MTRFAAAGVVVLVLNAGPGVAGPDEPAPPPALQRLAELDAEQVQILRGMLASDDARTVAWGAYEAARRRVDALVPVLLTLAADGVSAGGARLDDHAQRSVRAALVDLDAKAPTQLLRQFLREGGGADDDAIVLAVRRGSNEDLLMAWDTLGQEYAPWVGQLALGNRLARRGAKGFARRLLAALQVRLRVVVRDDDSRAHYRAPSAGVPGDGRFLVPPGYPPTVLHQISDFAFYGSVVLAEGIRPIYLSRVEWREREVGFGNVVGRPGWQEAYREFLAMLLDVRSVQDAGILPRDVTVTRRWRGAEDYVAWAAKRWDKTHRSYWALAKRLIRREVLTAAEAATLEPRVEVLVKDERDEWGDLPKLDLKPPPNPYRP